MTTVVYILGVQNCGSTLLDAVLGAAPGTRSLGEAGGFQRFVDGAPCDCGQPAAGCAPCRRAVDAIERENTVEAFRAIAKLPVGGRCLHWAFLPTRRRAAYAHDADTVFDAVAAETGATVLIDSSKNVGRAAALLAASRHDVRVVHLVRDPRGYIQSRQRRAGAVGKEPAAVTYLKWLGKNLLISALVRPRAGRRRFVRCRYEDLLLDPAATVAALGRFGGIDVDGVAASATGEGVDRQHLYEPSRRLDYRKVRLEAARLAGQRYDRGRAARFWWLGGFTAALWGYDRRQRYLDRLAAPTS